MRNVLRKIVLDIENSLPWACMSVAFIVCLFYRCVA